MQQPAQLYDSAATMFSPDGRIYQVEYAREAVKRGTTSVGVTFPDGVVLMVDKRVMSRLIETHQVEKLYKLDSHIGAASSGLVGDARVLVARARAQASQNRVVYGESIQLETLVKDVSDVQQAYTQNGGLRPFGAAFLIAGIDPNGTVRLYETDPSGAVVAYRATAIGVGRASALEFLEGEYKPDEMDQEKATALALKALYRSTEASERGTPDVAFITREGGYRKLTADEAKQLMDQHLES